LNFKNVNIYLNNVQFYVSAFVFIPAVYSDLLGEIQVCLFVEVEMKNCEVAVTSFMDGKVGEFFIGTTMLSFGIVELCPDCQNRCHLRF